MAKTKQNKTRSRVRAVASEPAFDGVYLFKMVLYLLLGSMWVKVSAGADMTIPLPVGLIIGLIFTTHEHFQIDRKIEYAVMLVAMLFGYFAPYGLYINF
ncbi:MAG: hypothetical protein ABWX94_03425 [Candidatus Saccharimonadales bacterium]